jgi:DHA1 family bicyclomycin/chloramphenicol resistance-like MFS transporter
VRGVETTMAAYLVGIAVSQLFYGPISDRFGRKPPLYFGFALYAIGAAGCALAGSMPALTLLRVVQALGGSSGFVIGRAIVRDRCEPHEAARAFSLLMMIVALGPVFAPVAGGFVVTHFGWRATFVFQTALGLALFAATHFLLRESRPESTVKPLNLANVLRTYVRLGKDRLLVGYSLVGGFGMGALFSYVTGAPTVLTHRYDLSPQQFGALIGLNGLAFMTASRPQHDRAAHHESARRARTLRVDAAGDWRSAAHADVVVAYTAVDARRSAVVVLRHCRASHSACGGTRIGAARC